MFSFWNRKGQVNRRLGQTKRNKNLNCHNTQRGHTRSSGKKLVLVRLGRHLNKKIENSCLRTYPPSLPELFMNIEMHITKILGTLWHYYPYYTCKPYRTLSRYSPFVQCMGELLPNSPTYLQDCTIFSTQLNNVQNEIKLGCWHHKLNSAATRWHNTGPLPPFQFQPYCVCMLVSICLHSLIGNQKSHSQAAHYMSTRL